MKTRNFLIVFLFHCLLLTFEMYGGTSPKNIVASKTNSAITIDGLINEELWDRAVSVTDFIQYEPYEGNQSTEKTSVRILYDDNALYVGVMCYDKEPNGIKEQLTRRDRTSEADRFSITIDSYNDGQTGFVFAGTVSGVQSDGVMYQDGLLYDIQWDAIWNYAAKKVEDGWSAEFEIPYSALRFSKQTGEYIWGINFRRYIARKKEIVEWVLIPRSETGAISKIGNVSGIVGINPPVNLSVMPYMTSSANFEQWRKPFIPENIFAGNLGLDIKYGITNNFTIDAAVNPDFGQVEVDQEVMNLTVFETHYPEKRPFFLEGAHIFSFGVTPDENKLNLFYSRRIGRAPRISVDDAIKMISHPGVTTILGAGKLTGQTESGLTIGAFTTVTEAEKAVYKNNLNIEKSKIIEPRASYNVFRLKQEIFTNSSIGIMSTGAFLDKQSPSFSYGSDWNLRFGDNTYAIDGYFAGSRYTDKDYSNNSINQFYGSSGKIYIGKIAGKHWLYNTSYEYASKNFNINELGFFSQPREHGGSTQLIFKEDRPELFFLRYQFIFLGKYNWNFDNYNTVKYIGFGGSFVLKNFWIFNIQFIKDLPAYSGEERGIIGIYKKPSVTHYNLSFTTDTRLPISASTLFIYEKDDKSKDEIISSVDLTLRPTTWFELTPVITFSKRWREETGILLGGKYITGIDTATNETYTIFGDRDLEYFDFALRGILTLTNKLSIQFFSQVFIYKWHYQNFKRYIDPTTSVNHNSDLSIKDLTFKTFNANIVLRWEFLPGSTMYFVWTQARSGYDLIYHKNLKRNITDTFIIPTDNVLLFKINYWFSF